MNALIFALTGLSLALLALAMPRHFHHVYHKNPKPHVERGLRVSGWLFLAVSLGLSVAAWDGGIRLVLWLALLAFHAFALSMVLAARPRWVTAWTGAVALLGFFVAVVSVTGSR